MRILAERDAPLNSFARSGGRRTAARPTWLPSPSPAPWPPGGPGPSTCQARLLAAGHPQRAARPDDRHGAQASLQAAGPRLPRLMTAAGPARVPASGGGMCWPAGCSAR